MIITSIEKAKKHLYNIYIDGEYALSLDENVVFENYVSSDTEISDDELFRLKKESDLRRAKEKAFWLLSFKDYSRKVLHDKLIKDYGEEAVLSALDRLEELNLINDERYAERLTKDLFEIKKLSPRAVVRKLIEKGIDKELACDSVDNYEPDETQMLSQLLDGKYRKYMFDEKGRRRVTGALMRAGYSYSDIKAAFDEFDEENEFTEEDDYYEC